MERDNPLSAKSRRRQLAVSVMFDSHGGSERELHPTSQNSYLPPLPILPAGLGGLHFKLLVLAKCLSVFVVGKCSDNNIPL